MCHGRQDKSTERRANLGKFLRENGGAGREFEHQRQRAPHPAQRLQRDQTQSLQGAGEKWDEDRPHVSTNGSI